MKLTPARGKRLKARVLTNLQYRILKRISPGAPDSCSGAFYEGKSKLVTLLGDEIIDRIAGKVVIDFGCGEGFEAVEMAQRGAKRVIGIDIREDSLQLAKERAFKAGVQNCFFGSSTEELADIVVSLDAFEHFADPAAILGSMGALLQPAGEVLVGFGQSSVLGIPWSHLVFREGAPSLAL